MSISSLVVRGYGSFGSINRLPTLGYYQSITPVGPVIASGETFAASGYLQGAKAAGFYRQGQQTAGYFVQGAQKAKDY